jgi:hypothetical protein
MSTRQFVQRSWKNENVILGGRRPLEALEGVFGHIFRPMSDPPHIDVLQLFGEIGTQVLLEINIQRRGNSGPSVRYHDPIHVQPIVDRNITNSQFRSFRSGRSRRIG